MQIKNLDELIANLQKDEANFHADRDTQSVRFLLSQGPLDTEIVLRWEAQPMRVQFICAFPDSVRPERIAAVEHAVMILNHRLTIPGFGMDNDKGRLYFRLVTPRQEDGSTSYEQLMRIGSAVGNTMIGLYELLVGVVNEGQDANELLKALPDSLFSEINWSDPPAGEAVAPPAEPVTPPAQKDAESVRTQKFSKIKLKSRKGDYLHRPDSSHGVTSWDTGIGNEWTVEWIHDDRIRLKSWKGDYLHRPESPRGVDTDSGNEWTIERIDDTRLKLKSSKGDYLHRPDTQQGVTTWGTGIGDEWTIEVVDAGQDHGHDIKRTMT